MPTLNRFPLLGLWAAEAARRAGYTRGEAEALGHAYAVLYAIRARKREQPGTAGDKKAPAPTPRKKVSHVEFGGDRLDVVADDAGKVRGLVGGEKPQTPASYLAAVRKKFPPGYYEKVQRAFRDVFRPLPPRALRTRLVYDVYDEWKRACAVGRRVDLEELVRWCQERAGKGGRRRRPPASS